MDGRVLFISPHSDHAGALAQMLEPVTIDCEYVASYQEARCRLENDIYDAILTEATLPDGNWKDVLSLSCDLNSSPPVIVTDRIAGDSFWAEILNFGCYDMLAQPFDTREVQRILALACGHSTVYKKPVGRAAASLKTLTATG